MIDHDERYASVERAYRDHAPEECGRQWREVALELRGPPPGRHQAALTCPTSCRPEESPTRRKQRCDAPGFGKLDSEWDFVDSACPAIIQDPLDRDSVEVISA